MRIQAITSTANPKIKELSLAKRKPSYEGFPIEGPNLIEMALSSGAGIKRVFMTEEFRQKPKNKALLRTLSRRETEIYEVPGQLMGKLSETETPQGVIAVAELEKRSLDTITFKGAPFLVVADGIKEPGNLGAIIRTADAAGADAVIKLPGTASPLNGKTLRASAGSFFNLPVIEAELRDLFIWLRGKEIKLCGTDSRAEMSLFEADLKGPVAFAFGEEAHGLSASVKEKTDFLLRIPILGKAESLNVAAACAVVVYECVRQRID
jgi:TrmH family RNA methyltransferase